MNLQYNNNMIIKEKKRKTRERKTELGGKEKTNLIHMPKIIPNSNF
jgi:hypothetical protein